jgi:hypothetical protein
MNRRAIKEEVLSDPPRVSEAAAVYLTSLRDAEPSNELVRINLLVPAHVRKEWKAVALATDRTMTDLIIEAMQRMIDAGKPPKARVR